MKITNVTKIYTILASMFVKNFDLYIGLIFVKSLFAILTKLYYNQYD